MEWLFFNAPWYAEYIYDHGIYRQAHAFGEEEAGYFLELFTRASLLTGTCRWCQKNKVTRMGMSSSPSGARSSVSFYCDACEPPGQQVTGFHPPSFFVETQKLSRPAHLRIVKYIKNRYIGKDERLTQVKIEEFFHNDANFLHATPGFFTKSAVMI